MTPLLSRVSLAGGWNAVFAADEQLCIKREHKAGARRKNTLLSKKRFLLVNSDPLNYSGFFFLGPQECLGLCVNCASPWNKCPSKKTNKQKKKRKERKGDTLVQLRFVSWIPALLFFWGFFWFFLPLLSLILIKPDSSLFSAERNLVNVPIRD